MKKKKLSDREIEKKFEKVLSKSSISDIESVLVVKMDKENYHLFGRYFIKKKDADNIIVELHNGDEVNSFFNMKSAVCWCVFDRRGLYSSANRIVQLDRKLSGLDVSIAIHKRLYNQATDIESRLIYLAKLNEEKIQKREMTDELTRYVTDSYNWQQKQFDLKVKQ